MNRQECNREILKIIKENKAIFFIINDNIEKWRKEVEGPIENYPYLRFGQILCNWFCGDYRKEFPDIKTKILLELIFPNVSDPFFEEPSETLKRIKSSNYF